MIKFTDDFMKKNLSAFRENYKYPVYSSMSCRSGFFSRYRTDFGFIAVTDDDRLLVVEYLPFGTDKSYILSACNLKKLKIKKLKLMPVYSVKTVFKCDGKTIKFDMSVSLKVAGCQFSEQEENALNLIETLKNWQKYIKE